MARTSCISVQHNWPWNQWIGQTVQQGLELLLMWYKLLLSLSSKRYHDKKEMVWKWQGKLTPYGEKLRDEAFETINFWYYSINITNVEDTWECRVTRRGLGHKERRCFFNKDIIDGLVFGGCSCGILYTDGISCHHMVAVVKSSRVEGLTATNSIPTWWSTEC